MFGWYIFVKNLTFGGLIGYSSGKNNSNLNTPSGVSRLFEWVNQCSLVHYTHVETDSHLDPGL
jgi:hypothetical protein